MAGGAVCSNCFNHFGKSWIFNVRSSADSAAKKLEHFFRTASYRHVDKAALHFVPLYAKLLRHARHVNVDSLMQDADENGAICTPIGGFGKFLQKVCIFRSAICFKIFAQFVDDDKKTAFCGQSIC